MIARILALFAVGCASVGAFAPLIQPAAPARHSARSSSSSSFALVGPSEVKSTLTVRQAMLTQTELPEKLYIPKEKEIPKVLGGLKIGLRQLVVITGASSGLGLNTAVTLAKSGRYFVVMACRDIEKGKRGEFTACCRVRWTLRGNDAVSRV
jgi:hypothetical protein